MQFFLGFAISRMVAVMLALGTLAFAADLKGSVINGTTRKPAGGDEVVLLTLSDNGMLERARTKADPGGRFSLPLSDPQATHVVRVFHQGVPYHKTIMPGESSFSVAVYDAAERVDGITAVMDVERLEATEDSLEVKQLITMRNASRPPLTLMKDRSFQIQLPPDAQVESGLVQVEEATPLKQKPVPGEDKGQYYFNFPLRPGDTRFAVVYRLPYKGEAVIEPKVLNAQERFVVMLPKSMSFTPKAAGVFQPMPGVSEDYVLGTAPINPGQDLAFRISGTGVLAELEGRRQQQAQELEAKRPGGGLGAPIDAPDPLHGQRWLILAGLAVTMAMGAVRVMRRGVVGNSPGVQRGVTRVQHQRRRTDRQHGQIRHHGPRKRRVPL